MKLFNSIDLIGCVGRVAGSAQGKEVTQAALECYVLFIILKRASLSRADSK